VRALSEAAGLAQSVAIGWEIYWRTGTPLTLGLVGLVQFLPMMLLMLPAGELCDRVQPRRVLALGLALQALCMAGLSALAGMSWNTLWPLYGVLALTGAARALSEPAAEALLPRLVAPERLGNAIAWSSAVWQIAVILGPGLGGMAYGLGATEAFGCCGVAFIAAALAILSVAGRNQAPVRVDTFGHRFARLVEGIRFVRSQPIFLGAISLDLVAVLFGGATALLPVYACDILHANPVGLGLLRSTSAAGACATALYQLRHPPRRAVGATLFVAVAAFGSRGVPGRCWGTACRAVLDAAIPCFAAGGLAAD
jgi:MFS family permease